MIQYLTKCINENKYIEIYSDIKNELYFLLKENIHTKENGCLIYETEYISFESFLNKLFIYSDDEYFNYYDDYLDIINTYNSELIKNNKFFKYNLKDYPEDLILEAIKIEPKIFKYLSDNQKTDKICNIIKNNIELIKYLPKRFNKSELYLEFIKTDASLLEYVPSDIRVPDFIIKSYFTNYETIIYMEENDRIYLEEILEEEDRKNDEAFGNLGK